MKTIYRIAAAALIAAFAVSCAKEPISAVKEENIASETSEGLCVTARIVSDTKLSISEIATALHPEWVVGDRIFGYSESGFVNYTVESIDAQGVATFAKGLGKEPAEGQTAYMVYAPESVCPVDWAGGELNIDFSLQDGKLENLGKYTVMCATAAVTSGKLELSFLNQTSIVGIKKFTGIKEGTAYNAFTFTGQGPTATLKVVDGVLKLVADDTFGAITVAEPDLSSTIYIAVPPAEATGHTFMLKSPEDIRVGVVKSKAFDYGKYYCMESKAMAPALFFDDFESYTDGALPKDIYPQPSSSYAGISCVSEYAKNGNRSLGIWEKQWGESRNTNPFDYGDATIVTMELYLMSLKTVPSIGLQNASCFRVKDVYDSQFDASCSTGLSVVAGQWQHVKIRHNLLNRDYQVWLDGKLIVGTCKQRDYSRFYFNTTPSTVPGGVYFSFGGTGDWSSAWGYIDDILVYTENPTEEDLCLRNPDNLLHGVFSVDGGKKVRFSSGYITKSAKGQPFTIYPKQWYNSNDYARFAYDDYTYEGLDYRWTRLKVADWDYILFTRENAGLKAAGGKVAGTNGVIILPDVFTDPCSGANGSAFQPSAGNSMTSFSWNDNTYDEAGWEAMENAGAIFIPARPSDGVQVELWTNTKSTGRWDALYYIMSPTDGCYSRVTDIGYGKNVRLIMNVLE